MSLCVASLRMQPCARTYKYVAEYMSAHGRHVATRGKTAAARLPSGIRCADEPEGVDISISLHTAMASLQRHGGSHICRRHIGSSQSSYCKTRHYRIIQILTNIKRELRSSHPEDDDQVAGAVVGRPLVCTHMCRCRICAARLRQEPYSGCRQQ